MELKSWDSFEQELNKNNGQVNYDFFEKRVELMATMINDSSKSVMDLGAGNMSLKKYLSSNVQYYPVDYCKKYDNTIVCDFNNYEFPLQKAETVFISGLIEYIKDYQWLIQNVCNINAKEIIVSYNVVIENRGEKRVFQTDAFSCNYENALTYAEILKLFGNNGYVLTNLKQMSGKIYQPLMKFERKSVDRIGDFYMCSGCAACKNVCEQNAITMHADLSHGYRPVIDVDKCINCQSCVNVCPGMNVDYQNDKNPEIYALWANDAIRKESSSGGAFTLFAEQILQAGGRVYGAAWDEQFVVRHVSVKSVDELEKLRISKYVQSDVSTIYREVERDVKTGKLVLFTGTPCQVAGIKKYIGNAKNLFTIDLLCMGSPSPKLFEKYLSENYVIDKIADIKFREKKFGNNSKIRSMQIKDEGTYLCEVENDMYQKGFHSKLFVDPVCEVCQFSTYPRQGDITIGDFWGIEKFDSSWDDGKGTSMVMLNSSKGKELFCLIEDKIQRYEKVGKKWTKYASRINNFIERNKKKNVFCDYVQYSDFNNAVSKILNNTNDIGIVSCFNFNYGNNLTNYALYQYLKDEHYLVKLIDAPQKSVERDISAQKLGLFIENPFCKEDLVLNSKMKEDLIPLNDICDVFILGSDQLLRNSFVEKYDFYTCLDWVRGDKYKMTYGTSFGSEKFEGDAKTTAKVRTLLNRIQLLSLREESGVRLARNLFDIEAVQVLDPIFLCEKKHYFALADKGKERIPQDEFVAAYILDLSEEREEIILQSSQMLVGNRGNVAILDASQKNTQNSRERLNVLSNAKVEEWLAMIHKSSFFITDSFHGVCFALIFQKQFCVVTEKSCWRGISRITSLLEKLGLSDRIVYNNAEFTAKELGLKRIDYSKVNKLLNEEILKSKQWLKQAISKQNEFKGEYTMYDEWLDKMPAVYEEKQKEKRLRNDFFIINSCNRKDPLMKKDGENMTIVVWGAGNCLLRNLNRIQDFYELKYVCDNDVLKWGKEIYDGIYCISPAQLKEMKDVVVIICIDNVSVAFKIANQLLDMGICNFDHVENWLRYIEEVK